MSPLSASGALQQGVVAALKGDAELAALLGGPKVLDHLPERAAFPYVTLGESAENDWSTGTEPGHEHLFTVHVWSRGSRGETHAIMARVETVLDARPALPGHRLVTMALQRGETRREPGTQVFHARMRFRATTEPLD